MGAGERGGRGRWLALDEVVKAGVPAIFSAFGDHLVYVGGSVYALPREPLPAEVTEPRALPGAYVLSNPAGVEYGWHHLHDCGCSLCATEVA